MQAQHDVRVTVRVDKALKENAELLFSNLGMNMSVAFNVFLKKAVDEQAIPFKVGLNKARATRLFDADKVTEAFQKQVAEEVAEYKEKGLPVARYDVDKRQSYLEYPDGSREYSGNE